MLTRGAASLVIQHVSRSTNDTFHHEYPSQVFFVTEAQKEAKGGLVLFIRFRLDDYLVTCQSLIMQKSNFLSV
jgi:hypothetical protein